MNREVARELLGAARPGDHRIAAESGHDDVCSAFACLEGDEALRVWYERECAMDEIIAARVAAGISSVPHGLRERLLEGIATAGSPRNAGEPGPFGTGAEGRGSGFSLRAWGAIAASLAVLGVVGLGLRDGWFSRSTAPAQGIAALDSDALSFLSFRHAMADYANGKIQLGYRGADRESLKRWVGENAAPEFDVLPDKMTAFPGIGCAVVDWDGQKVSLFCFKNTANGNVAHLFVVERKNLRAVPLEDELREPAVCCGLETVAWEDTTRLYLLVGHEPDVPISDFF